MEVAFKLLRLGAARAPSILANSSCEDWKVVFTATLVIQTVSQPEFQKPIKIVMLCWPAVPKSELRLNMASRGCRSSEKMNKSL